MQLSDDDKMWIVKGLLAKNREYMDWLHHPSPKSHEDKAKLYQDLADIRALTASILDTMTE